MAKNCPECGKFMKLVPFEEVGKDPWDCWLWWACDNDWLHKFVVDPIPAPEYQWEWNCQGIPGEALVDCPDLFGEYKEMWERLPKSAKRQYAEYAPDKIIAGVSQPYESLNNSYKLFTHS